MKTVKIAASVLSFSLLVPVLTALSQGSAYAQRFGDSDTEGRSEVDRTNRNYGTNDFSPEVNPTNSESGTNGFSSEVNPINSESGTNDFSPEVDSSNSDDEYGSGTRVGCDDIANGIIQGAASTACSDSERGVIDLSPATDNAFPTNNIRDAADQFDLDPLTIETPNNPNSSGILNLDSSSVDPTQPDSVINDVLVEVDPIKLDSVINDVFSEVNPTNPDREYGGGTRVACDAVANSITEGTAGTACSDAEQGIQDINAATDDASTTNSISDTAEEFAPSAVDPTNSDGGISGVTDVDPMNPTAGISEVTDVDPMNPTAGISGVTGIDPMNPTAGISGVTGIDPMNPTAGISGGLTDIDPMNPNAGINEGLTDIDPMNPNAGISGVTDIDPMNPNAGINGVTDIDPTNPDANGDGTTTTCDAVADSYTNDPGTACSDATQGI